MLEVTEKQLDYWERLRIVPSRKGQDGKVYDFSDLIGLRTAKQLIEKGIPANRLRRSLSSLRQKLSGVQETSLADLRVVSNGKDILVERDGARLEALSGQFVLNFETREIAQKVCVMPQRGAEQWMRLAEECEADRKTWAKAIDAYERVIHIEPQNVEAWINSGTLRYEQGEIPKAVECFRRAVELDPANALAQFNLGSALEETGELELARHHLRAAISLDPGYSDAHYNLAFVCEKLVDREEAREHWQRYIALDPASPWCTYARERLDFLNRLDRLAR